MDGAGLIRSSAQVIVRGENVVSCELDGGEALLDLDTSVYYALNSVGACIWRKLASPVGPDDLAREILNTFDVDAETCTADLAALLGQMAEAGLIRFSDA